MSPEERKETFGRLLRRFRRRAGVTQGTLAEWADIERTSTISDLERDQQRPRKYTAEQLADALELRDEDRDMFLDAAARAAPAAGLDPDSPGSPPANMPVTAERSRGSAPASLGGPGQAPDLVPQERRPVTILACYLSGPSGAVTGYDPETAPLWKRFLSAAGSEISRYGGESHTEAEGWAIAVFGADRAHEDDPERALLCAAGIRRELDQGTHGDGVEHTVRAAIVTREIVRRAVGNDGRAGILTEDSVDAGTHLALAAAPTEILVDSATAAQLRQLVRLGDERCEVTPAGPVSAFPVLLIRGETRGRRPDRERSSLVGRSKDLAALTDLWELASTGQGSLVTILGEAGVGKSRLASELREVVSRQGAQVLYARCLSYRQAESFWLVADLVRSAAGILEGDSGYDVSAKLASFLVAVGNDPGSGPYAESVDVLGEALGAETAESPVSNAGPEVRRQALVRAVRRSFRGLSSRGPTLLILEDLQWIDQASDAILDDILSDIPGLPVLVVVTHRPGWNAPWSDRSWSERISLRTLKPDESRDLAGATLGGELSQKLSSYIVDRSRGNPFYIRELLRFLNDVGGMEERDGKFYLSETVTELVPPTLNGLLLARLDRLGDHGRFAAQIASLVGTFSAPLLAKVMDQTPDDVEAQLSRLRLAEIILPAPSIEPEYSFTDVLVRDAAYNTLVPATRKQFHLRTARALAVLAPSDAETIAYHYANSDPTGEAVFWTEKAADRAAATYANAKAVSGYETALRCLDLDEHASIAARMRLTEKLGSVQYVAGNYDQAIAALTAAVSLAREDDNDEAVGRLTARLGAAHRRRGSGSEGIALVEGAIEQLQGSQLLHPLASLYISLAHLYFQAGRSQEQLQVAAQADRIAQSLGDQAMIGEAQMRVGSALTELGSPAEGFEVLLNAMPSIESGGDRYTLWAALNNCGSALQKLGRPQEAATYMERALTVAEEIGNPSSVCFTLSNLGFALTDLGDWTRAAERFERAVEISRRAQAYADVAAPFEPLGQLRLWRGDVEGALRYLTEGLERARESGHWEAEASAQAYLAELEIVTGRPDLAVSRLASIIDNSLDQAPYVLWTFAWALAECGGEENLDRSEEAVDAAMKLAENQLGYLAEVLWIKGIVRSRRGDLTQAERVLVEGLETARSLPFPYCEARILTELASVYKAIGDLPRARMTGQQALQLFETLGAQRDAEQMMATLAGLED